MGKEAQSSNAQPQQSILKNTNENTKKGDILDRFRDPKVCDIPATNNKVKRDCFDELRPPPKTVLNYNISQTDTKLQKLLPTGMAKVHLQQTTANYVHPPPDYVFPEDEAAEPKKVKRSSGGPPIWEFVDEKWRKQLERKQSIYKNNLKLLQIENKKYIKAQLAKGHKRIMKLVGPAWFQELSVQQMRSVDNLKNCIINDKKYKCYTHTKDNIGELGLALRPCSKHIERALNHCCECPVEFLLVLYQLMNRKRMKYSINDRLLLSAVAHLTMRETLKELHIRIPSPPPPPKKEKLITEKPSPPHYKSPYLVPFDFVPCPRKHSGIYKNKHIQYPECPYFSYLTELKQEMETEEKRSIYLNRKQSGITLEQHNEILGELKAAQRLYGKLVDYKPVPYLLKPSIYIPCDHGLHNNEEKEVSHTDLSISAPVKVTTDYEKGTATKYCKCNIVVTEEKKSWPSDSSASKEGTKVVSPKQETRDENSHHERQILANIPEAPLGKPNYVTSGVQHTSEENALVKSGAVCKEDCTCMKLFKAYQERHVSCLDAFETYLQKMEMDVQEYMKDVANDPRFTEKSTQSKSGSASTDKCTNVTNAPTTPESSHKSGSSAEKTEKKRVKAGRKKGGSESSNTPESYSRDKVAPKSLCICMKPLICQCEGGDESPLNRFIILDKIPPRYDTRMEILKKALSVMAEDGFPLAKLPGSWRLPIFKLWMEMRCGKYWTQEDRVVLYCQSMVHWRHLSHCQRKTTEGAKLDMSNEMAEKYTWAQSDFVRKLAAKKETAYYRNIKQVAINDAREFFPSIFSYQLPTSNFRDCFFAYAPAKEDECTYYRPWYPHEFKK